MKKIRLYGEWGRRFGREFELDVKTPAEAIRALCAQVQGFRQFLHDQAQTKVRISVGQQVVGEKELTFAAPGSVIRIVPVIEGSSGGGRNWGLIIVGVILLALSWPSGGTTTMSGWQTLGMGLGMSLITSGVTGLLTKPPPKPKVQGLAEPKDSFAFDGAINATRQGNPVPICYGRMLVGSQVISLGLNAD